MQLIEHKNGTYMEIFAWKIEIKENKPWKMESKVKSKMENKYMIPKWKRFDFQYG